MKEPGDFLDSFTWHKYLLTIYVSLACELAPKSMESLDPLLEAWEHIMWEVGFVVVKETEPLKNRVTIWAGQHRLSLSQNEVWIVAVETSKMFRELHAKDMHTTWEHVGSEMRKKFVLRPNFTRSMDGEIRELGGLQAPQWNPFEQTEKGYRAAIDTYIAEVKEKVLEATSWVDSKTKAFYEVPEKRALEKHMRWYVMNTLLGKSPNKIMREHNSAAIRARNPKIRVKEQSVDNDIKGISELLKPLLQ